MRCCHRRWLVRKKYNTINDFISVQGNDHWCGKARLTLAKYPAQTIENRTKTKARNTVFEDFLSSLR
jgi:hypothetical protein